MYQFGCLQFWAPTCFPEVICPRYDHGNLCQVKYSPCDLFKMHSIDIDQLKEMAVRSRDEGDISEEGDQDFHTQFIIIGSNWAILA